MKGQINQEEKKNNRRNTTTKANQQSNNRVMYINNQIGAGNEYTPIVK
jgi:hypothetical protein